MSDPEGRTTVWQALSGSDAARFSSATGTLSFATPPDFESPADAGGDNEYNVTIGSSDGLHTPTYDLAIMVTNTEETGNVTLFPLGQPQVGTALVATLRDPDIVASAEWRWERSASPE